MILHKGEIGHIQHPYKSDELMKCRLQFFNHIFDIFKVFIPNNKSFYEWEGHGVENIPRKWRQIFLDSINKGYDHDKIWEQMRKHPDTITRPEGKTLSNEDYDNDHRTKHVLVGKWKYGYHSIHIIDAREGTKSTLVNLKHVEMNGVKVNIVSQTVQLIINTFEDKLPP